MHTPVLLAGLEEIPSRFDGLIVDQWGVLHDGSALFPASLEALRRLRERGKRVVLLSNTGRRLGFNLARLAAMGLEDGLIDGVVTSGETAWQLLHAGSEPFAAFGRRCLLWPEGRDRSILEGLDLVAAGRPEDADFILLTGLPEGVRPDDLRAELQVAAARGLPMICCNPDRVVVVSAGVIPATGSVAALYEALGGAVHYVGKPHAPVYRACLDLLRPITAERVLAVGDSLEHDVAGGRAAGFATALVVDGIHRDDLGDPADPDFRPRLEALAARHGVSPTFVLRRFTWSGSERNSR